MSNHEVRVTEKLDAIIGLLRQQKRVMTEYELGIVRMAFERALLAGGPGLSEIARIAIVNNATQFIRQQLNVPAPNTLKGS